MPPRPSSPRPVRARGAALLTAMVIVTLVATLASAMLWQQWRSVALEAAERSRAQSSWILLGALDWARLILREDKRSGGPDHLGEPWAMPLAEARLSTFLASDRDRADDAPEAFLSGRITDAQARLNLTNLTQTGQAVEPARLALQQLCEHLHVDSSVAQLLVDRLARLAGGLARRSAGSAEDLPLLPPTVAQLRWLGVDDHAAAALAPHLVILPRATPVNINTASREVLAAVLQVDLGTADRIIQARQRSPFRALNELGPLLPGTPLPPVSLASVESDFFEVLGRLRLDQRVVEERSLLERRGLQIVMLQRERTSLALAGTTP